MTARRFLLLLAAALTVLAIAVTVTQRRREGTPGTERPVLARLATQFGDVTQVRLYQGAAEPRVTLNRQGGAWTLEQRAAYPADSARLRRLLVALAQLRIAEEKTADSANYALLGVDDPRHGGALGTEVTIVTPSGSRSLIIGKPSAGGNFVRDAQDPRSVLAVPGISVDVEARDWIEPRILDIKPAQVREVSIKGPKGAVQKRSGTDFSALAGLDAADVGSAAGLDWHDASVATVTLTDGSALVLSGIVAGERHWLTVSGAPASLGAALSQDRAFDIAPARYSAIFQP